MPLGPGGMGHQPSTEPPLRMLATPDLPLCACMLQHPVLRGPDWPSKVVQVLILPSSGWAIGQAISGLWDYISMER